MLRLAGLRINPATNGPHRASYYVGLELKKLADGSSVRVALPPGARIGIPEWRPDGKAFLFLNTVANGIELWRGDPVTGKLRRMEGIRINAAYGDAARWMPDNRTILAQTVPAARAKPPEKPAVPEGPTVQESFGKGAAVRTYEDMLQNEHDEDLFDYYATSQLVLVDSITGRTVRCGRPGIFARATPSPDGKLLLVELTHRPFSYLYPVQFFPRDVEVWDTAGKMVKKLASLPLADSVPPEGVPVGPRRHAWHPVEPATVEWWEALDEGNPRNKAPFRDRIMFLARPFTGQPVEFTKTQHRAVGVNWLERDSAALVTEYERERRWVHTRLVDRKGAAREVWSRDTRDSYGDPGDPVSRTLPTGHRAVLQDGAYIYLTGQGASAEGDRPFLDRLSLTTLKPERLFRSEADCYESVTALVDAAAGRILTWHQSPTEPPNLRLRTAGKPDFRALTAFKDSAPQLRKIAKRLVTYKRPDGVQLSFTLYLPPDYKEGTRLPTVVWAYPREYSDPSTAGQIVGSTQRFTSILGTSHLFYLLAGYAVLDNATMPVVGDPQTMNDTYIEQIVESARAAIDKAVELGVTDRDRVGVGGHSYGAFMTANLLAHCRLFRAGVARSGAYNRTLTPFGFQSERRTLWEAPQIYAKLSPFFFANAIKDPLLLIHGEADDNQGTFPIQSERMYHAVRGNAGNVRLVMLPFESHGYQGRESVEHTLYEMIGWFDRFVKDAPPR
jgi:dipeptidyl aminopeptidase/acylaminoacyl peptidase